MNLENRNPYRLQMGKPEGKRPLGRPRCRWVDNMKMNLVEMGWIGGAQDSYHWMAFVNGVMNL
jgi:hypothetical protein